MKFSRRNVNRNGQLSMFFLFIDLKFLSLTETANCVTHRKITLNSNMILCKIMTKGIKKKVNDEIIINRELGSGNVTVGYGGDRSG